MSLIRCPECGNEISDKASICIHCGAKISVCAECGTPYVGEGRCPHCGYEKVSVEKQHTQSEPNPEPKKKDLNSETSTLDANNLQKWYTASGAERTVNSLKIVNAIFFSVLCVSAAVGLILYFVWSNFDDVKKLTEVETYRSSIHALLVTASLFWIVCQFTREETRKHFGQACLAKYIRLKKIDPFPYIKEFSVKLSGQEVYIDFCEAALFATDPKAKKNKTIFLAFDMLMTGLFSFFIFLMFIMGFAEWVMYPQVKLPVDVPLTDNGLIAIFGRVRSDVYY